MPVARFQLPDGRVARFEVPEGTSPEQAQAMIQAQLPSLAQPQAQLPESLRLSTPQPAATMPSEVPGTRKPPSTAQRMYEAARPYVAPTVEALGAVGGGLLGATAGTFGAGPVGTAAGGVAGAGLGYGIAKEALEAADVAMGVKAPRQGAAQVTEPVRNILEGATFEAGGRVAGPLIAKGIGKVADLKNIPKNKAANLARASLGDDLGQTLNALRTASPNESVAEITAKIQNPAWQALVRDALEKSPSGAQYLTKFAQMSHDEGVNALAKLAGGTTAAQTRATVENAKNALNAMTEPQRQAALNRANLGKSVAEYEAQAAKLGVEAAAEVQKVRDLISAGKAAEAWARLDLIKRNLPVGATKYTYFGELGKQADEWASRAADASLDLGQGARFAQGAADALRSVGIKPLEGGSLVNSVKAIGNNPEFAGNDVLQGAIKNVADDIAKWTSSGGIIDAKALDAIRKNSVNAAIQQLRPGMDATAQRNLAAGVLNDIKPALIDAVEAAGGTGYRQYLADYSKGMQKIAERKLTGEALQLWKTNKDEFVRLVQNESPETVEKILGPGKYNIATELADNTMTVLQAQADKRIAQVAADKLASDGEKALTTLLRENSSKFRLPSWLSFWSAATNKTISELEKAVGSKSMKILADAMQSPEKAKNLLETLPATERSRVLGLLADPSKWSSGAKAAVTGTTAMGVNALAPDRYNTNALAGQPVRVIESGQ